ncbi:Schwann cell myelin protein-like [Mobula birostris]|uniref:Schwann cell myelin protein-like n=1 Tax=Mobula birostris TaxID=1983395 RepID=UPI003B283675
MAFALLISILFHATVVQTMSLSVNVPRTLWAVYGSCMEIQCTFDQRTGLYNPSGMWLKGGSDPLEKEVFTIYRKGKMSSTYERRAEFTGNLAQNGCSLRITGVSFADKGVYCFRVTLEYLSGLTKGNEHGCVTVSVITEPQISVPQDVVAGRMSYLTCSLNHSCPSTRFRLKWILDEELMAITQVSKENGKTIQIPQNISTKFTFTPSPNHDSKRIGCELTTDDTSRRKTAYFTLDVHYPPENVSGPTCTSFENWINCTCKVKAKPAATITWRVNGKALYGQSKGFHVTGFMLEKFVTQGSLILSHQAGVGQLISCVAVNVHGTSNGTFHRESSVSGSLLRDFAIAAGITAVMVIVILTILFAYRKIRRTSRFDAQADESSEPDLHQSSDTRGNTSPHGENVIYSAFSISNFHRNQRHHQNEEKSEYAAIKCK